MAGTNDSKHFETLTDEQLETTRKAILEAIVETSNRGESVERLTKTLQNVIDEQSVRAEAAEIMSPLFDAVFGEL